MLPIVAAALAPLLKDLFANGLNLLGNAVLTKGKEKVEEVLRVKLPSGSAPLSTEQLEQLRGLQFEHEEKLLSLSIEKEKIALEGEKVAQEAVTKRWEADMLSDSWLSKNIRPLALIVVFGTFAFFALLSLSESARVDSAYVTILGELLKVIFGAYFVGRSAEKGIDLYQGWKQTKGE